MSLLYVDVVFMYQVEDHYGTSEYICHFSMSIFYKCKTWYVISVCQYLIYVACGMPFWYVNTLSMYHVVCHYCMSIFYLHTMWYVISVCQYFFSVPNGTCHFSLSVFFSTCMWYVISVCQCFIYIPRGMSFQYVYILYTYHVVCHFHIIVVPLTLVFFVVGDRLVLRLYSL